MKLKLFTIPFLATALVVVTLGYAVTSSRHRVQNSLYLPLSQQPEQKILGGVSGRVVDADGRPVRGTQVFAEPYPRRMGLLRSVLTDDNGNFVIDGLEVGRYKLSVEKEEDGYPRTGRRFYAAGFVEPPEIVVYANQIAPWGDVPLGPKAAKIGGSIRDAITGKRLAPR